MDKGKLFVLLLMALVIAVLVYFAFFSQEEQGESISPAETTLGTDPEQEPYTTLDGEPTELTVAETTHTLVYSWASWCASCRQDLIVLNEWKQSLVGTDALKIIAINRAESEYAANQFVGTLPELSQLQIILDPSDRLFSAIEGYAMPEYVLYDQSGNELLAGRGELDLEKITAALEVE